MEPTDIIDRLPLKKNATTSQLLVLLLSIAGLIVFGWVSKTYFDTSHNEIIAAIAAVDKDQTVKIDAVKGTIASLQKEVDGNSGSIDALKRYTWFNSDMARWAQGLDRANRQAVPALIVPEVPPPPQVPPH
jgi:hypothetical protein